MIILPGPDVKGFNKRPLLVEDLLMGYEIDGVEWRYTNVTGWYLGGVSARSGFEEYPNGHGAHDAPVWRGPRVIGVEGYIVAKTHAAGVEACDVLNATLADGRMGTFAIDDPDVGYRYAKVRISSADGDYWDDNRKNFYTLQFTAPDPRKYGASSPVTGYTPSSSGSGLTFPLFEPDGSLDFGPGGRSARVTVTNPGTADTPVRIAARGPHLGGVQFTRPDTGQRIVFPFDIPDGAVLTLDSATGRAKLNGAERTGKLTRSDFWNLPGKSSADVVLTPLGPSGQAGTFDVLAQPAYW